MRYEAREKADQEAETLRQANEKVEAAEKAIKDAAKAKVALVEVKEWENRFTAGSSRGAEHDRQLVTDYPNSPEPNTAQARIDELEAERERLKD